MLSRFLALCIFVLPVAAQSTPAITRISPASGPRDTTVQITIYGDGLTTCNPGCHLPEVKVGGIAVRVDRYEPGFLDITIPPSGPGAKDVVILRNDGLVIRKTNGFTVTDSTTLSVNESILLPIATPPISGAFGSRWVTEIFARNHGEHDVRVTQEILEWRLSAPPPAEPQVAAKSTQDLSAITSYNFGSPAPGYVMKIDRRYVDDLHFSLHSKDLSRSSTSAGTEIPVVREREMYNGTIVFPAIPTDARFRQLLRVYDPFPRDGRQVRVRVFAQDATQPIVDRVLPFAITLRKSDNTPHPSHPGYVQYDPREIFNLPTIMPLALRIQLDPVGEPFPYWGFVSITNNDTQHVTTVTPQ